MTAVQTRPELGVTRAEPPRRPARSRRLGSLETLVAVVVLAIIARGWLLQLVASPRAATFATVAAAVLVQGLPFLVMGTLVAAALRAFVPAGLLTRVLAGHPSGAVPLAALAGVVLPVGAEAAADAGAQQMRRGTAVATALAYCLAAPALSPVVLIATVVAFPDEPAMVFARAGAGLVLAVLIGWMWLRPGRPAWLIPPPELGPPPGPASPVEASAPPRAGRGWPAFWSSCRRDLVRAGGMLAAGALASAVVMVALPASWPLLVAARTAFAVVALALLAVLLSVPAEADAFVAACLTPFPVTARLVFLTVGPVVNLRLFGRQTAVFGPRFAVRAAPVTLVGAILVALAAAGLLR